MTAAQDEAPLHEASQATLRIAFVPGVTVGKWTGRWRERHPDIPLEVFPVDENAGVAALRDPRPTVSFVRLPVDREGINLIRLYAEVGVLAVSRDSELAVLESVTMAQLDELPNVMRYPMAGRIADALALVATGSGAAMLPHSVARLHARKDVVAIPIADAPETEIALIWPNADNTISSGGTEPSEAAALIEEFIGIVRGRTASSSRGTETPGKRRRR